MAIELRIHGRGGQGAVIASLLLAKAFCKEGYYVQSFPEFGVERRGSPVQAYLRADKKKIYERTKIYTPNQLIILDPTLIKFVDVAKDIAPNSIILINSPHPPSYFELSARFEVATIDASAIALSFKIGTTTNPIVNTTALGAYARFSQLISLDSLKEVVKENFDEKLAERNISAIEEAYKKVILPNVGSKVV